ISRNFISASTTPAHANPTATRNIIAAANAGCHKPLFMSKSYGRLVAAIVEGLTAPQKPWRRANTRLLVANALYQRHEVPTPRGPVAFVTTHPEALQFPRDLLGREPETIAWIDSFETPCRFWDVGAN